MKFRQSLALATIGTMVGAFASSAIAATEIQWWHAMSAKNGERVNAIADGFNKSQTDYKVVPVYKGNYTETLTAAVAAFRANKHPHIVQVFEVGTATTNAGMSPANTLGSAASIPATAIATGKARISSIRSSRRDNPATPTS